MVAVSGGLIFVGYQLMVYGWSQLQGSNAGFFDILWPGRYEGPYPDPPSTATGNMGTGHAANQVTNNGYTMLLNPGQQPAITQYPGTP